MVHSRRVTVARARPLASRSRAKDSMSARRTANRCRDRTRHQLVNWRRSSAYASRVRPRYPARNPASASRSASVKAGWIRTRAVDGAAVVIGHLPAGLRPGGLGQLRVPAIERNLNVSRLSQSQRVTARSESGRYRQPENVRDRRVGAAENWPDRAGGRAQIIPLWSAMLDPCAHAMHRLMGLPTKMSAWQAY